MCQLDASECYRCISERFEAQHRSAAAFDGAMILAFMAAGVAAVLVVRHLI
jgi:hypothetical protein